MNVFLGLQRWDPRVEVVQVRALRLGYYKLYSFSNYLSLLSISLSTLSRL